MSSIEQAVIDYITDLGLDISEDKIKEMSVGIEFYVVDNVIPDVLSDNGYKMGE